MSNIQITAVNIIADDIFFDNEEDMAEYMASGLSLAEFCHKKAFPEEYEDSPTEDEVDGFYKEMELAKELMTGKGSQKMFDLLEMMEATDDSSYLNSCNKEFKEDFIILKKALQNMKKYF